MAWLLLIWAASPSDGLPAADTLVVCPPAFVAPLEPWIAARIDSADVASVRT
jgi:hypothetical protein